jgi:hypothetical protein
MLHALCPSTLFSAAPPQQTLQCNVSTLCSMLYALCSYHTARSARVMVSECVSNVAGMPTGRVQLSEMWPKERP